jgi:hypothetical protein
VKENRHHRPRPPSPPEHYHRRHPNDIVDDNNQWLLCDAREVYGNRSERVAQVALIRPRRLFQYDDDDDDDDNHDGRSLHRGDGGGSTGNGTGRNDHRQQRSWNDNGYHDDQEMYHHSTSSGPTLILPDTPERVMILHRQQKGRRNTQRTPNGDSTDHDNDGGEGSCHTNGNIDDAALPSTPRQR